DHPRLRRERQDEQREVVRAAFTVPAEPQHVGGAGGEHAAHVVGDGLVESLRAEAARAAVRPHHEPAADLRGRLVLVLTLRDRAAAVGLDHRDDGDRLGAAHRVDDVAELGEGLRTDLLHQHVDHAAAGEPDGRVVVVADAVTLQHRDAGVGDLPGQLVHRALDAAAGDAADRVTGGADRHGRAGAPRRPLPGAYHPGHPERPALGPQTGQLVEYVTHGPSTSAVAAESQGTARNGATDRQCGWSDHRRLPTVPLMLPRRLLSALLATATTAALVGVPAEVGHASTSPLSLSDATRTSTVLQPGVTLTRIVAGTPDPRHTWTIEIAVPAGGSPDPDTPATALSSHADAREVAAALTEAGLEPRVERVTTPATADYAPGTLGWRVRIGRYAESADAAADLDTVEAAGYRGSAIFTGWDGAAST